jgi:hypothetical protein
MINLPINDRGSSYQLLCAADGRKFAILQKKLVGKSEQTRSISEQTPTIKHKLEPLDQSAVI